MAELAPKIVRVEDQTPMQVLGNVDMGILNGSDTGGSISVGQQITEPGSGPPFHMHTREDETFLVLEGEYEFLVGGTLLKAPRGTVVFAPRNIPHCFRCVGNSPGRIHITITPAGFERFFAEVSAMSAGGPPDFAKAVALAKDYGCEIYGPAPWPEG